MKYRCPPGIIFCGLICCFSIYLLFVSKAELAPVILLLFAFLVLIADVFLQWIIKRADWLWIIETVAIIEIIVLNTKIGN